MTGKQKFMKRLEEKLQFFDRNVSYITNALEDELISTKLFISRKLDEIISNIQEAFDIYKKIKLSKEEDWNTLRPLASGTFHKLTKEFSTLITEIKKQKMKSNSFLILKEGKDLLTYLKLRIKKYPSTSILTALSVGFTFGKVFISQGKNTKFS